MRTSRYLSGLAGISTLLIAASAGVGASGVEERAASTTPTEDLCPDGPSGDLDVAVVTEVNGFDPTIGGSVGINGGPERAAVLDVLVQYDAATGEFEPRMAESLTPNDDATEWTLTLRDGITFANGNPVTTAAVEYSINLHAAEDTRSLWKPQASLVESMDIVDDLTIVFHLSEGWGGFPAMLSGSVGMLVDPAVFDESGSEAFGLDPQGGGAGPYTVSRFAPGEELVLEARSDYWGGPVCVQTLRFVLVTSEETREEAFLNGEFDVAVFQTAAAFAELRDAGFEPATVRTYGNESVLINHGTGGIERPGSDVRVRQAIAHALDVDLIDQRMTGGVGYPSSALLDETSPLWTPDIVGPEYDPDLARDYLEQAMADGYDGAITLSCHNTPQTVEWAIAVQGLLQAVGFDVTLENDRSLGDHVSQVYYAGDYDIACLNLSLYDDNPWGSMSARIGQNDPVTLSRVGYVSEPMAEALAAVRNAITLEERQAAMVQVQQVWNEEIPQAITNHSERGAVWHDDVVEGLTFTNTGTVLFSGAVLTDS